MKLAARKMFRSDRIIRRTHDGFFSDGNVAVLERLCNFTAVELAAVETITPTIASLLAKDLPKYAIGRATNLLIEEKGKKKGEKILYRAMRAHEHATLDCLIWVNNRSYIAISEACDAEILVLTQETPVIFRVGTDIVGVIMPYNAGPICEAVH